MKKLEDKIEGKLSGALGEFQGLDFSHWTDHFQVTVDKGGTDGEGVEDQIQAIKIPVSLISFAKGF